MHMMWMFARLLLMSHNLDHNTGSMVNVLCVCVCIDRDTTAFWLLFAEYLKTNFSADAHPLAYFWTVMNN